MYRTKDRYNYGCREFFFFQTKDPKSKKISVEKEEGGKKARCRENGRNTCRRYVSGFRVGDERNPTIRQYVEATFP